MAFRESEEGTAVAEFAERFRIRKAFDLLSDEERRTIHEGALEVLETTGVRFHSAAARDDLRSAGAVVDDKTHDVRFPRDIVEEFLRMAPRSITLAGRATEFDLPMDGSHSYYTTDGCGIAVWDASTGTRRASLLEDIRKTAILGDWLPYVSIYEPMVVAHDVPESVHVAAGMMVAMENTQKHLLSESTTKPQEARVQVAMAAEVLGSLDELRKRHYVSAMLCTVSPLIVDGNAADAALVWAENHVPVHITSMAQAGVTGPASLAGDLVVSHAETLAVACMLEAHEPGTPAIYGSVLSGMDPRTGSYMGGSPESTLLAAGSIEMAKYCRLPISVGGFGSSAKIPGIQASLENALIAMVCATFGGEVVNGLGVPDGSTLLSYEQLLLDHEIAGMVLKICRGFEVNSDTIALDLIKKVGIGGNYLAQPHTLRNIRDNFVSMVWDSDPFDVWVQKGAKDPMAMAREKVEWILQHHPPVPLDPDVSRSLERIVKESAKA